MKIIRSTKCSLKFSTKHKRKLLSEVLEEYGKVVNFFIDHFWDETPKKAKLLKDIVNLPETWLTARLRKVAAREAIDMILSAKNREDEEARKHKPHHYGKSMHVSSTIAALEPAGQATEFDCWLHLQSIGNKIILDLPIKLHKHYHKQVSRGRRLNSYIIKRDCVHFCFEVETGKKKEEGKLAGLDTGIIALATLDNGTQLGTDIKQLVEIVKRKQHGSNKQKTARRALKQRMDEVAKELAKQDLQLLVVEDLQKLNYKTKLRRRLSKSMRRSLGIWAYRYWLNRVQMVTEDNRISLRRIPPAYTSQRCSSCSHTERGNRNGKNFLCRNCGYVDDADVNAAKNILFRFTSGPYGAAYKPKMKPEKILLSG